MVNHHWGGFQVHKSHGGGYCGQVNGACGLVLVHGGRDHSGHFGFHGQFMWCSILRTVILHFRGFTCGQGPCYLLESQRWHFWFGSQVFLLFGCQLWGAFRWGWAERKPEDLLFFLQEVPSSLMPTRAMVAAAQPEVSHIARDTSYGGCHMGQMHFHPSRVFWFCGTPHIASCFWRDKRIGWLICWCSRDGDTGDWLLLRSGRDGNQSGWHVLQYRWHNG